MILLLDDNEYRRKDISWYLMRHRYIHSAQSITDADYFTKPVVTVYVNPTSEQISKIKNENTITIVAKNKKIHNLPFFIKQVPNDKNLHKVIMKEYDNACKYFTGNQIDVIGYVCTQGDVVCVAGAILDLSKKEIEVAKLFLCNSTKKFSVYDASQYIYTRSIKEVNLMRQIYKINRKCHEECRDKLICYDGYYCYANPEFVVREN